MPAQEGAVRALLRVRHTARAGEPGADEMRGIVNEVSAICSPGTSLAHHYT